MMKAVRHRYSGKTGQLYGGQWLIGVENGKVGENTSVRVFNGGSGGGVEGEGEWGQEGVY
jgi:hypothetical protein